MKIINTREAPACVIIKYDENNKIEVTFKGIGSEVRAAQYTEWLREVHKMDILKTAIRQLVNNHLLTYHEAKHLYTYKEIKELYELYNTAVTEEKIEEEKAYRRG